MPTRTSRTAAWTTDDAFIIDLDVSPTIETGSVRPAESLHWFSQAPAFTWQWFAQPHVDQVLDFGVSVTTRNPHEQPRRRQQEQPIDPAHMSELGRRLLAIRERYLAEGGTLLTREQIDAELRERRGERTPSEDDYNLR